jgi:predicted dehydrogenase
MVAHVFTRDLTLNGFKVGAVGSRSRKTASAFADGGAWGVPFDIPHRHGSYQDLVADDDVDVIYVATPNSLHAEHALLALEAGKHVLVEKPFAMNKDEAEVVFAAAARRGRVALEAMWTRWLPHMHRIREILSEGALGQVASVLVDNDDLLPDDPMHRTQRPELGGGALLDLGVYAVSFVADILGAPSDIRAMATATANGVDGRLGAVLAHPSGAMATIHTQLDGRGPRTAAIVGTDARIEIDSVWYTPSGFTVMDPDGRVIERFESEVTGRGMQYQAEEMERLVRDGATEGSILSPAESISIMGTLDAIRQQIAS